MSQPFTDQAAMTSVAPGTVQAIAHPSLALVKYWGKQQGGTNLPATSSLAVTLAALETRTSCVVSEHDRIRINGTESEGGLPFLSYIRTWMAARGLPTPAGFTIESENNFPTAAGLASSASGYAALAIAATASVDPGLTADTSAMSALARNGSGSAARSIFGGITVWRSGAEAAEPFVDSRWWPELRVVVLPVSTGPKSIGSREAMNRTRSSSPYYQAWVDDAPSLFEAACAAVRARDIERLGTVMRSSYLRMFGTMFAAEPPIIYWQPNSIEIIHELDQLRRAGIPAWETMDAGPQIKVLTTQPHAQNIAARLTEHCAAAPVISALGDDARLV